MRDVTKNTIRNAINSGQSHSQAQDTLQMNGKGSSRAVRIQIKYKYYLTKTDPTMYYERTWLTNPSDPHREDPERILFPNEAPRDYKITKQMALEMTPWKASLEHLSHSNIDKQQTT